MNCKSYPTFRYEKSLWKRGFNFVAGLDEVGRGAFAGPVTVGLAVYDKNKNYIKIAKSDGVYINDSKRLTEKQRSIAYDWIRLNSLVFNTAHSTVGQINKRGITEATYSAFRRVVSGIIKHTDYRIDFLLIDAYYIPYMSHYPVALNNTHSNRQIAIIKGDSLSFSIASASIIAKVTRDILMQKYGGHKDYTAYKLAGNKGYGTKAHRDAIIKYGAKKIHRSKYVSTFLSKVN